MSVSTNTANIDLDADYGSGSPATLYAALATAAPNMTANSGRGSFIEPTTGQYAGYARVALTNNPTNFPGAAGAAKVNGTTITFPTSGGGASSPVTLTHLLFVTTNDASCRIVDALAIPGGLIINNTQAPTFPASAVTVGAV